MKVKAVLFDMDGVLIDSMPYHFISWFETLKHYGIRVTPTDIYAREGEKWIKSVTEFFAMGNQPLTKKRMREVFNMRDKIFKKFFTPFLFEGAEDLVKLLKNKGYLIAIVTGSGSKEAKRMLPKSLYECFDTVVGGDMVKHGKPHPEPYLIAAKKLKVKPSECLVIENAPYGIKSAKAAKMCCFAVQTSLPHKYLKEADKVFPSIAKVYSYFNS